MSDELRCSGYRFVILVKTGIQIPLVIPVATGIQ